jgi:hypothetical protein
MAPMDRDGIVSTFESVLGSFGLDPERCREGDGWWRFRPDDLELQGGIHRQGFRVTCALAKLDPDASVDEVYTSLTGRNATLPLGALAVFAESDRYLCVRSELAFADLSAETMKAMIDACMALARSPTAHSLRAKYRAS